jgi:hypothetical protein
MMRTWGLSVLFQGSAGSFPTSTIYTTQSRTGSHIKSFYLPRQVKENRNRSLSISSDAAFSQQPPNKLSCIFSASILQKRCDKFFLRVALMTDSVIKSPPLAGIFLLFSPICVSRENLAA